MAAAAGAPRVLSVIAPMTQLNTPYPSTAYLTGFLRARGVHAVQEDLALALVLELLLWDELLRVPYFLFAVVVLLFSLGPRDLDDEVEDYLIALEAGDTETQRQVAEELLERSPPESHSACNEAVERAST